MALSTTEHFYHPSDRCFSFIVCSFTVMALSQSSLDLVSGRTQLFSVKRLWKPETANRQTSTKQWMDKVNDWMVNILEHLAALRAGYSPPPAGAGGDQSRAKRAWMMCSHLSAAEKRNFKWMLMLVWVCVGGNVLFRAYSSALKGARIFFQLQK